MFKKIKEKVLGLFGKKEKESKKLFGRMVRRVQDPNARINTWFYYQLPFDNFRVSAIVSCWPRDFAECFISGKMICLVDENGEEVRLRNSFVETFSSKKEEEEAIAKLKEITKIHKSKDCKFSNEQIDEI